MTTPLEVSLAGRDFLRISDLVPAEAEAILDTALSLKDDRRPLAPGSTLGLYFAKHSTRTRVSFTVAIAHLGGSAIPLTPDELQLSRGESLPDTARALSGYLDALAVRVHSHAELEEWAHWASIPVINALTAEEHPCQALADCQTLVERWGSLRGRTIAFVGDGNNVAASLAQAVAMLGGTVTVASPHGYELPQSVCEGIAAAARFGGGVSVTNDPLEAVSDADAIYTDVWASMGQEEEAAERRTIFQPYQVNAALMAQAPETALFMHCLPAHRGDEVTDEVMDSPASIVFDQSENRLHTQKALLALLAGCQ